MNESTPDAVASWSELSHEQLYAAVHDPAGDPAGSQPAEQAWKDLGGVLDGAHARIRAAVGASSHDWVGLAADVARTAFDPLHVWTAGTVDDTGVVAAQLTDQSFHAAELRRKLPPPVSEAEVAGETALRNNARYGPAGGVVTLATDIPAETARRRQDGPEVRHAHELMGEYSTATRQRTGVLDIRTRPPAVVVGGPVAPTGPAAGSRTPATTPAGAPGVHDPAPPDGPGRAPTPTAVLPPGVAAPLVEQGPHPQAPPPGRDQDPATGAPATGDPATGDPTGPAAPAPSPPTSTVRPPHPMVPAPRPGDPGPVPPPPADPGIPITPLPIGVPPRSVPPRSALPGSALPGSAVPGRLDPRRLPTGYGGRSTGPVPPPEPVVRVPGRASLPADGPAPPAPRSWRDMVTSEPPGPGPVRNEPVRGATDAAAARPAAEQRSGSGFYPPMGGAGGAGDRSRRRPGYLRGDLFRDDRWFPPAVITPDDPPPAA